MSDQTPLDDANEADVAEQRLSTTEDDEPDPPADPGEANPADAAEQTRPVSPDDDYPHDLESSVEEA
jgi:hypothetical protein